MSDDKVLTKEIAEQFIAGDETVYLSQFTTIEDAAAESLGKHEGRLRLKLSGLTELSDVAAESLGKHTSAGIRNNGRNRPEHIRNTIYTWPNDSSARITQ
jgi:hypothetical protein